MDRTGCDAYTIVEKTRKAPEVPFHIETSCRKAAPVVEGASLML